MGHSRFSSAVLEYDAILFLINVLLLPAHKHPDSVLFLDHVISATSQCETSKLNTYIDLL